MTEQITKSVNKPATEQVTEPQSGRRVQRMRHELKIRPVTVSNIAPIGPHFLAITFQGPTLADFISASFDDHIKFMFDHAGSEIRRDYTPTAYNAASHELTLQFALHDAGKATAWAKQAKVGDTAVIGGPRGSVIMPLDVSWHLLIGDNSALPAIERRLAELPANSHAIAVLLVPNKDGQRPLASSARTTLHWCYSEQQLLHTLSGLTLPTGAGFSWAAGEASLMQQVKQVLTEQLQQPKSTLRIGAYWRKGEADFHRDLTDD